MICIAWVNNERALIIASTILIFQTIDFDYGKRLLYLCCFRFSCQLSWNEDNRRSPELEVAMSADAREEKRFLHERDRRKMRKDKVC